MNIRGGDARKKVFGPRPKGSKDRDEDLLLFREMQKREKDRIVSLLQPVSDEFEANGNYALNGMAPGKKGPAYDIFAESGKNDYDWLKTPPATPLFQSLEMETNLPELAVQREIPILQPLTRFAGNAEAGKASTPRSKSPQKMKPKVLPRYSTPSGRASVSLAEKKNLKSAPVMNQKVNQSSSDRNPENSKKPSLNAKSLDNKESQLNFLASNISKSLVDLNTKSTKPKSRGVSPSVRSRIPAQIQGLSDETPPNLKTHDRSISTSRGRKHETKIPGLSDETPPNLKTRDRSISISRGRKHETQIPGLSDDTPPNLKTHDRSISASRGRKQETITKSTRQSRSPSVTRGRKQDHDAAAAAATQRDKIQQGNNNRTQVLGSRMVDRFLNARMSSSEERQSNKMKLNASMNENSGARKTNIETKFSTSINEGSGFGRLMSKSSLDMALKHMEFPKDSSISRKNGTTTSRRSSSVSKRNPIS